MSQQADPYSVGSEAGTSKVSSLSASGGVVDVTNNKIIISQASFNSPTPTGSPTEDPWIYDGVHGLVQQGRGNGVWDGTSGITTSMTDATSGVLTSLATASGAELGLGPGDTMLFGGQTMTDTDTVVMYTWGGDADLNGDLNGDDYFFIDSNVINSGSVFGYTKGDFDYNGLINGDDYFILDSNITFQNSTGGDEGLIFWVRAPERGDGGGLAAVPEPASIGVLGMAACSLLGRRRRR
jgi:hypothetical protein